jgi:predicted RNase H-like HicB family nuclease
MSQPLIQSDNKQGYSVVIEKGDTSYGAYVPDLPGCVAVSESLEEVETLIAESIDIYLEVLQEKGLPIPKPTT